MHVQFISGDLSETFYRTDNVYHNRKGSNQTDVNVRFPSYFMTCVSIFLHRKTSFRKKGNTTSTSCVLLYSTRLSVPSQQKMQIKDRRGITLFQGTAQVMFILLHVTRDDKMIHLNNSAKAYMRWGKASHKAWERCRCHAIGSGVFLSVNRAEAEQWVFAQVGYDMTRCWLALHQRIVSVWAYATDKALNFLFRQYKNYRSCEVSLPLNYAWLSHANLLGQKSGVPHWRSSAE